MTVQLLNKTKNEVVVSDVETASSFAQRLMGLMGRRSLTNKALWIPGCNSIHTCFMRFPIDLVFVDRAMTVVSVKKEVQPWRLILPVFEAYGVFELPQGCVSKIGLGDVLNVDTNINR